MAKTNPYTLAAIVGLTSGQKHHTLNKDEVQKICEKAKEIGETALKVTGDSLDGLEDEFPAEPAPAEPTTPTGQAPAAPANQAAG